MKKHQYGKIIRKEWERQGRTQEQIAEECSVTQKTISELTHRESTGIYEKPYKICEENDISPLAFISLMKHDGSEMMTQLGLITQIYYPIIPNELAFAAKTERIKMSEVGRKVCAFLDLPEAVPMILGSEERSNYVWDLQGVIYKHYPYLCDFNACNRKEKIDIIKAIESGCQKITEAAEEAILRYDYAFRIVKVMKMEGLVYAEDRHNLVVTEKGTAYKAHYANPS